ncbi:MAG: DNA adenine methylase [Kiloniellaceae bacterium]
MFDSPLRYPGGKGRLSQYVIELIEMNDLVGGHYVEPYAGGAGIAISLLYLEYVSHIHLNDLSKSVFSFWHSVKTEPEALCRLVRDTPISVREWKRQKAIQTSPDADTLALGFSTFFLNRTNRSGIIRGGIIGGKKQTGAWKIDARFNRAGLIQRIEKIASYGPRISLYNKDAAEFLTTSLKAIPKSALVYLDPPYYSKGQKLYENHYQHGDHAKIALLVGAIRQKWIVSYDNSPALCKLYSRYRRQTFDLLYSAQTHYTGDEVMIFCDDLKTPGAVEPFRGIAA